MMVSSEPEITPNAECNPVWNEVGTNSSSVQFYLCCGDAIIRVDLTDALGALVSSQRFVASSCGGGGQSEKAETETASLTSPQQELQPTGFIAFQNYPNPFNPETEIRFGLPEPSSVRITVSDALGREISTLADGNFSAGYQRVTWNGVDASGVKVPSGVYFYRIVATGQSGKQFTKVLKMALTK